MNWLECGTLFLVALIATATLVPVAKKLAVRLDAIDYPSARRVNTRPTPRLGGVAIFLGLTVCLAVLLSGMLFWGWPNPFVSHPSLSINYPGVAIGVAAMFAVGVVDDVKGLNPKPKLAGQVIAACIVAGSGLLLSSIYNPFEGGFIEFGWLSYPLTVFYLVAFANIINLIDGLDGLAAGITAIASISLFVLTLMSGRLDAAALAVALAGCCVGFLRFNFNPASIFMGDSGALTLGFLLGVVALLGVTRTAALTTLIVPLIVAGVPIIDTFAAIIRRRRGHTSIGQADKGHIQHRLISQGFNQRQAVLLIYAWSILLSIGAFAITQVTLGPRIAIFVVLVVVSVAFVVKLHLFEPVLRHYYNPETHVDAILPADDPVFDDATSRPHHGKGARRGPDSGNGLEDGSESGPDRGSRNA